MTDPNDSILRENLVLGCAKGFAVMKTLLRSGCLLLALGFTARADDASIKPVESPPPDWRDAHELETFSSVCEELPLPGEDECDDGVVIDIDEITTEPMLVTLSPGVRVRISRLDTGSISMELVPESPVQPLPGADTSRTDHDLGKFQVAYASMVAEGRVDEARALAASFLCEEEDLPSDRPRALSRSIVSGAGVFIHRAGFRGDTVRRRWSLPSNTAARWEDVRQRTMTVAFKGATLDQVAKFLQVATGLAVDVEVTSNLADSVRFEWSCQEMPVQEALNSLLAGRKLAWRANDGGIEIREQP